MMLITALDSAVVKTILQSLLDSFLAFKPVSLEMTPGLEHTLNLIRTFVTDMMTTNSDEEIKSLALSLQLAMGLIVGSVMTIVQTVEVLACNKWMINDKVMAMVAACSEIPVDFDISFPNGKVIKIIVVTRFSPLILFINVIRNHTTNFLFLLKLKKIKSHC